MTTYSPRNQSKIIRGELLGPPQVSYASEPQGKDFNQKNFMKFYRGHMRQKVIYDAIEEAGKCAAKLDPVYENCFKDLRVISGGIILEHRRVSDYAAKGKENSTVHVFEALQVVRRMPYGRFSIMGSTPQIVSDGQLVVCDTHPSEAGPFLGVVGVDIISRAVENIKDYQNGSEAGPDKSNFDSGKAFDELFKPRVIGDAKNMGATGVLIGEIESETDIGGPSPTIGNHPISLYLPVTYLK